jgi:outer membrane protein TolC
MKPFRSLLAAALALAAAALAPAQAWTAEEAVATALRQHPDVTAARHRIEACRAMLQQVDSAWQPQVILSGHYIQSASALTGFIFTMNQRNFGYASNPDRYNRPGWVDDLNFTGKVVYNLYAGGAPTAQRTAAGAGARAAEEDLRGVQQQLAAEVIKALLHLRKAREGVSALEAALRAQDASVVNARLRFEAGQVLKADLLSLEVQLARTREALSSARHAAALAARAFTFALGSEPSTKPVDVAPEDPALANLAPPATADFSARPELAALEERQRMAEALITAARAGNRPTVNAFVAGQFDQGWRFGRHAESVEGGVSLNLHVFDGGRTAGKVRQAQAELAQIREQLRKARLGIGLEVERARLAHADAVERLAVTSAAVLQAEESAALSRARFEQGVLLAAELIGTESRLTEVRLGRVLATADERLAIVELRRALGLSPTP